MNTLPRGSVGRAVLDNANRFQATGVSLVNCQLSDYKYRSEIFTDHAKAPVGMTGQLVALDDKSVIVIADKTDNKDKDFQIALNSVLYTDTKAISPRDMVVVSQSINYSFIEIKSVYEFYEVLRNTPFSSINGNGYNIMSVNDIKAYNEQRALQVFGRQGDTVGRELLYTIAKMAWMHNNCVVRGVSNTHIEWNGHGNPMPTSQADMGTIATSGGVQVWNTGISKIDPGPVFVRPQNKDWHSGYKYAKEVNLSTELRQLETYSIPLSDLSKGIASDKPDWLRDDVDPLNNIDAVYIKYVSEMIVRDIKRFVFFTGMGKLGDCKVGGEPGRLLSIVLN